MVDARAGLPTDGAPVAFLPRARGATALLARWLRLGLLSGMIAGCAVGGPLPSPVGASAPVSVEVVPGAGGAPLAASVWPTGRVRAVLLAVHGFGDYGPSTFSAAAAHWAERGITTYAYDQRGFGRNASRGVWPGADRLIDDLVAVAEAVRARHPCRPLVVVGHSMGGGIAMAAALRLPVEGVVLAAPAIWGGANLNPLHRAAAWSLAATMPDRRLTGGGLVRIQASDNLAALRRLAVDPVYLRAPSAREILGLVRISDRAAEAAPRVRVPALMLLGARDQIVPGAAVERVFAQVQGLARVIHYPEGWHLLFRDLQAPRVWTDVADWSLARSPPACPG
jgi:alpha-beta hydrolase superfamily lysophospholipase